MWLSSILNEDKYPYDKFKDEAVEFYKEFYDIEINKEELTNNENVDASRNIQDKELGKYVIILGLFVLVIFLSIVTGKYPITLDDIFNIATGGEANDMVKTAFTLSAFLEP